MSVTPKFRPFGYPAASMGQIERLAVEHGVPVEDVLLIAINLYGISSTEKRHRARVAVRLVSAPQVAWQVIVPLNVDGSPLELCGENLMIQGQLVAHVERIDADEAVGGYFRDGGRAATPGSLRVGVTAGDGVDEVV